MVLSVLIIGGNGLVGSSLVRENTARRRYKLGCLSRSCSPANSTSSVRYWQGNALEPKTLVPALADHPAVVHTVGTLTEQTEHGEQGTYESMNCAAAVSVARAMAAQHNGTTSTKRCFLYFSAAHFPPAFVWDKRYGASKRAAEAALLGDEFKDTLRVVIFRPSFIYSFHQRLWVLPVALCCRVGSLLFRPLTHHLPEQLLVVADKPLLDDEVARATFEAIENEQVQGVCDIDRIRLLARQWEERMASSGETQ
ncbi:hypothetical protein BDF14DRAFT_1885725 [Spinellus fusiger]|nr:hypothetical protein BDF14DRAFT_1885725 [Spinellus fusiger]